MRNDDAEINNEREDVSGFPHQVILSAALVLLGLGWMALSVRVGLFVRGGIAGGFMPFVYGVCFTLLSLSVLIFELRTPQKFDRPESKPLLILGVVIAAVIAIPNLGGFPALFLLMMVLFVLVERRPLFPSLLISSSVIVCFWLAFSYWLRIRIPTGFFGI